MPKETKLKITSAKAPPPPSFVKLAMRNMVRKGKQSLSHLAFTAFGLVGVIVLLAWFARPNFPH